MEEIIKLLQSIDRRLSNLNSTLNQHVLNPQTNLDSVSVTKYESDETLEIQKELETIKVEFQKTNKEYIVRSDLQCSIWKDNSSLTYKMIEQQLNSKGYFLKPCMTRSGKGVVIGEMGYAKKMRWI